MSMQQDAATEHYRATGGRESKVKVRACAYIGLAQRFLMRLGHRSWHGWKGCSDDDGGQVCMYLGSSRSCFRHRPPLPSVDRTIAVRQICVRPTWPVMWLWTLPLPSDVESLFYSAPRLLSFFLYSCLHESTCFASCCLASDAGRDWD